MEEKKESILERFLENQMGIIIGLFTVIGILFALAFILGAWYSCDKGEGTLTGLKCSNIKIVEACEDITGKTYTVPKDWNNTDNEFVPVIGQGVLINTV